MGTNGTKDEETVDGLQLGLGLAKACRAAWATHGKDG